jgi:hypothetical protein
VDPEPSVAGRARDVRASGGASWRQRRSTQRHGPAVVGDDAAVRAALRRISRERPRWGYRGAHALLLADG